MSSDIFQYKPLEHRDSFRLLHLEPSLDHSADLKGSLHHATLSDYNYDLIEPYTALSYVWGDSNNAEKGLQVAMMGRIYSTAHHTVIHLGKSPKGFEKLVKDLKVQSQTMMHENTPASGQFSLAADEVDYVWVRCGDLRMRWHHFCPIVETKNVVAAMLLDTLSDSIVQQGQPRNLTPLKDMNSRRYGAFEAPLSTILFCRRGIGATDPRDIVFGHLGVVSDRDRCDSFTKIDYDRDLAHASVACCSVFTRCYRYRESSPACHEPFSH
ncbi:uncharacterized protein FPRO_10049 [Fusarium proliferatum ET1]|uniref:Related to heterokaryon incompatibility protein (Het-6OR allele) n=1 Tax=Fusarium proliferatum (strain ET1) TaxID=1227346 RepID=A0A1L7VRR1_FUSPR|nr:uncharacterized protein FPRO_10049 [Fusarium proliferatum ET1]CZR42746.1 related to heterokaryon incompatibility protein (het-6OR allele) [Fusarium proliferatum ET1]